jgi:hypothetical protein
VAHSHICLSPPGSRTGHSEVASSQYLPMEQEAVYEPPGLVEIGDFTTLTRGLGSDSLDAVDYFSGFIFW